MECTFVILLFEVVLIHLSTGLRNGSTSSTIILDRISSTSLPFHLIIALTDESCRYLNSEGIIPASAIFKKGENTDKARIPEGAVLADDISPPSDDEEGPVDKDNEG